VSSQTIAEVVREWIGVVGAAIAIPTAFYLLWRELMLPSFWPIRIVGLEPAEISDTDQDKDTYGGTVVRVKVETLKRTSGPITKLTAYIEGMEDIKLNLLSPYRQPPKGIGEQILTFGTLPDGQYQGKELVMVAECRMRKGKMAIKKKISIGQ
jgi:hypothetical protein